MAEEQDNLVTEQPAEFAGEPATEGIPPEASSEISELETLKLKLAETQKGADAFKDQWLRKAAEFENLKRRTEADALNLIRNANERLILALVPTVNDFIRSLKSGNENKDYDAFYKGVELIYNNFVKVLEKEGLKAFESTGKPFDVQYHDALLQMPKNGVEPNTVIEEIERGYMLHDRVLRHAKVIVSAEAPESPSSSDQEEVKE